MTRNQFVFPLGAALALAACSGGADDASYGAADAAAGAEFRFLARDIVAGLDPVCPLVLEDANAALYDGLRGRMQALETRVAGTPRATDLAVVRADYREFWSRNTATCSDPDTPENTARAREEVAALEARMDALEAAAS